MKKKAIKIIKKEPFSEQGNTTLKTTILWLTLSGIAAYLHMTHIEIMFENDKHFSHLSELERELSFRTESSLYYYYFKLLANNESLIQTGDLILNDDRTEYPSQINSLKRFNLYSEFITGLFYRLANKTNLLDKNCYQVERGDNMPPVESCVGYSEPIYFYVKSVFILNGLSMAFLFTLCFLINKQSISSGLIGCLCYFYNHSESTRVMWTPALRESFSFPFHILQMVFLTQVLQMNQFSKLKNFFFILSTVLYVLTWQFAQFSLGSQLMSLFATYSLGYLKQEKFFTILKSQTLSLIICYILMFANRMLMTSLFASLLLSIWILLLLELMFKIQDLKAVSLFKKITITISRVIILLGLIFISKKYVLKFIFQQEEDDSHIWDILRSKFNDNLHTFDTRLYTCAKEFDFIETETLVKITKTLLLPFALLSFIYYGIKLLISYFGTNDDDYVDDNRDKSVIVYNMFQLIAFTFMACLIMRLKLFWVPHLCVFASLIANDSADSLLNFIIQCFNKSKEVLEDKKFKTAIVVLIIGLMSYKGIQNLKEQHRIQGEYSDYTMEKLMNWINKNTKLNDSFAGNLNFELF